MKLPSRHGKLGRVLRAMIDAGPMTAGSTRIKAGMNNCKHCQRGIPLQHGIHLSELEMVKCERSNLALEPIERDTWYQPGKRRKENAPFVVGG